MVDFFIKRFNELDAVELYELLALRSDIVVVEQDCVYQDIDGKDHEALHVLGKKDGQIIAYARLLNKGVSYPDSVAIGRVAVANSYRGKKIGHEILRFCIRLIEERKPQEAIRISAQAHLEEFYKQHGFKKTGKPYLEDGIPHIGMIRRSS